MPNATDKYKTQCTEPMATTCHKHTEDPPMTTTSNANNVARKAASSSCRIRKFARCQVIADLRFLCRSWSNATTASSSAFVKAAAAASGNGDYQQQTISRPLEPVEQLHHNRLRRYMSHKWREMQALSELDNDATAELSDEQFIHYARLLRREQMRCHRHRTALPPTLYLVQWTGPAEEAVQVLETLHADGSKSEARECENGWRKAVRILGRWTQCVTGTRILEGAIIGEW